MSNLLLILCPAFFLEIMIKKFRPYHDRYEMKIFGQERRYLLGKGFPTSGFGLEYFLENKQSTFHLINVLNISNSAEHVRHGSINGINLF